MTNPAEPLSPGRASTLAPPSALRVSASRRSHRSITCVQCAASPPHRVIVMDFASLKLSNIPAIQVRRGGILRLMAEPAANQKLPVCVAIVCKNSEATIGRTLDTVKGWAAEIVALDSGSTDDTIPMLEAVGARVIRTEWLGHVKTKQKALEAAGQMQPWVLSLDSDESPEPALIESIRAAVTKNDPVEEEIDGYTLNRKVFYDGRFLNYAWQPERRLRLVRSGKARWQGIDPHDQLVLIDPSKKPGRLDGDLRHDSFQTFEEQLRKQVGYARLMASELVARGEGQGFGPYWDILTSPSMAFLKQMVLKQAWRDGWSGWLAAAATAQQALMKHALIIELARKGDPKR